MDESRVPLQTPCRIGCPRCDIAAAADESARQSRWQGWRLAALCLLVFLWPLALAVVGSMALPRFWSNGQARIVGGAGGLLLGAIDAVLIYRWFLKPPTEGQE